MGSLQFMMQTLAGAYLAADKAVREFTVREPKDVFMLTLLQMAREQVLKDLLAVEHIED
jgi:hypothetical protein